MKPADSQHKNNAAARRKGPDLARYLQALSHNGQTGRDVQKLFNRLALPVPEGGEFYRTFDDGALLPLSRYGCVLRFTAQSYPQLVHTRILQPLLSVPVGDYRADLFPGLRTPHTGPDYSAWYPVFAELKAGLEKDGITLTDINSHNGGQLPRPYTDRFVILDPGALRLLARGAQAVKSQLAHLPPEDPQERLFNPLRTRFQRAASSNNNSAIDAAWRACQDLKQRGLLVSNWEEVDYNGTQDAARCYERRLAHRHAPQ